MEPPSSNSHSLARSTSNRSRVHWRMSSFRMSSTSSASNSISSSPSKGCDLGSNRLGSNGSVSLAVSKYWANCQGSKMVFILATKAGISARKSALSSAASRKSKNFSPTRYSSACWVPNSSSMP